MGFLDNCTHHFGNRFGCINEPIVEEEDFGFFFPPMFHRFNRFRRFPRRRMWRRWW